MFGIQFIKVEPTDFVLQFKGGKIVREGAGLSFFYYAPTSSLVRIPMGSVDVPFIFEEVTADFQTVTVQGQLTYRVADPRKLAQLMNFTVLAGGRSYASDDPGKLPLRLINTTQVLTRASLKALSLRAALGQSDALVAALREDLRKAEVIGSLGIEVLALSILAIKPTPETARALEASAREQILREADEAVYARRNAAVEQERAIKENELNTEVAVENKKRQIKETQMDAEKSVQQKQHEIREAEMTAKIALETQNRDLVALATVNARDEADVKAYAMAGVMKALSQADPKSLQALVSTGMAPGQLIALAFKELAENAGKIGELNISSELLSELLSRKASK
ncbi:MAG: SPFH domain-containing protein [Thermoflexales bacterium]|nr:SPFH domain-containing protein [Thermoflexales bacterium]MBP8241956.1 SPFH domain-containing protein [Thermoflexales bacterium]